MSRQIHQDELAFRFLLGQLSEEEQAALEQRLFEDDSVFEEFEIAEEELIERFLDSRLGVKERASFERRIATSPRLRDRIAFARMLADKVDATKPVVAAKPAASWWERIVGASIFQRPAYRIAFVSALMILVLGGIGWMVRQSRLETQQMEAQRILEEQQKAAREREASERRAKLGQEHQPSPAPVPTETASKSPGKVTFATLTLVPGGSRSVGGPQAQLKLQPTDEKARLTLIVEDPSYSSYVVQFEAMQSHKIFTKNVPHRKNSESITLELRVSELPSDDYTVKVYGVTSEGSRDPVSNYSLSVRRK